MPIYEYFCVKCNMEFELIRPFSEAGKGVVCPKCNSVAQKLISSIGSKTGSYVQASSKPFRKMAGETVKETKKSNKVKKRKTKRSQ